MAPLFIKMYQKWKIPERFASTSKRAWESSTKLGFSAIFSKIKHQKLKVTGT